MLVIDEFWRSPVRRDMSRPALGRIRLRNALRYRKHTELIEAVKFQKS